MMTTLTPIEAIALLEDGGYITPRCAACAYIYKDAVSVAARMTANPTTTLTSDLASGATSMSAVVARAERVTHRRPRRSHQAKED
jgi:hypothetical protein